MAASEIYIGTSGWLCKHWMESLPRKEQFETAMSQPHLPLLVTKCKDNLL